MNVTYDIPVVRRKQVLVIGAGCAGLAAAVCAARHGADTLLADANGCIGGMASSGLVGPFMTSYDPEGTRQVIRGVYEEMIQRMMRMGGAKHPSECPAGCSYAAYRVNGHQNCAPFSAECFKQAAEDLCTESGVELLYHASYVSSCMNGEGTRIEGAVFASKAGLIRIDADIVIDCTGDGDVAFRSGAPCVYGDEEGNTQPSTLFFTIRGIDKEKMEQKYRETGDISCLYFGKEVQEEMDSGRYTVPRNKVGLYQNVDGTWRVNMSRVTMKDGCDPFQYTDATLRARRQVKEIMDMLRRVVPGCENIELVQTASMLGHRETRRIQGDFVLTGEDIHNRRPFDDVIFMAGNSIDMHGGNGKNSVLYIPEKGDAYPVPYRILVPAVVKNLLAAGRCASLDRAALAAIRVMPPVFAMGQAAGTAAALCVKHGCAPADISVPELQQLLRGDDAVLE